MHNLKYLVTGTGRCGTVFMAKLLTSIGIPCGHESIFNHENEEAVLSKLFDPLLRRNSDCSTYDMFKNPGRKLEDWSHENTIAESSYLAVPFLFHPEIRDIPLIHVTRHPLDVVSSFVKDLNYFSNTIPNKSNPYNCKGWEDKIYKFCQELPFIESPLDRACWFYLKWTNEIDKASFYRSNIRINIENTSYNKLFEFLGVSPSDNLFSDTTANNNKKRTRNFELKDISNNMIKMLLKEKMLNYNYK